MIDKTKKNVLNIAQLILISPVLLAVLFFGCIMLCIQKITGEKNGYGK